VTDIFGEELTELALTLDVSNIVCSFGKINLRHPHTGMCSVDLAVFIFNISCDFVLVAEICVCNTNIRHLIHANWQRNEIADYESLSSLMTLLSAVHNVCGLIAYNYILEYINTQGLTCCIGKNLTELQMYFTTRKNMKFATT